MHLKMPNKELCNATYSIPLFSIEHGKAKSGTGISPEAEPSAARLAELTKIITKENDIKIIYFEENASRKNR